MKNCIGCGIELTRKTRSAHQPEIRCLKCFNVFTNEVKETLKSMIKTPEVEETLKERPPSSIYSIDGSAEKSLG